jgi:flavin-dependent thymidylate synthase
MKVTLVNFTPDALETLIFTKSTRLRMTGRSLDEIRAWPIEKKMAEWEYMQNTIKSSWEFADYIFTIEGVTRAFTHQLVRHRVGTSFAQQAQRVVNMSDFEFLMPPNFVLEDEPFEEAEECYKGAMQDINDAYQHLISIGANPQDARGVLPTNILTNICFKANLRTLNGMCAERLCVKAQGEFQDVMRAIRSAVVEVHPWAEPALRVACAQHGVCAFPSYVGCPVKDGVYNPETGRRWDEKSHKFWSEADDNFVQIDVRPLTKPQIQELWEVNRAEAQPTAPKEDR